MKRILIFLILATALTACKEYPLPKISGHRGANFIAPENTMASLDYRQDHPAGRPPLT